MSEAHEQPTVLFLHGAGGFHEDAPLAATLADSIGARLVMPMLPDDDMTYDGWAAPIRTALGERRPTDHVVGHSFGGSILLKVLAEGDWAISRAVLLAIPHWGPAGWDVAEYAFDRAEPVTHLVLHHCRDDEIVPFDHLALNQRDLPNADVRTHDRGGHQFDDLRDMLLP